MVVNPSTHILSGRNSPFKNSLLDHLAGAGEEEIVFLIAVNFGHNLILGSKFDVCVDCRDDHFTGSGIHYSVAAIVNHDLHEEWVQNVHRTFAVLAVSGVFQRPSLVDYKWKDNFSIEAYKLLDSVLGQLRFPFRSVDTNPLIYVF